MIRKFKFRGLAHGYGYFDANGQALLYGTVVHNLGEELPCCFEHEGSFAGLGIGTCVVTKTSRGLAVEGILSLNDCVGRERAIILFADCRLLKNLSIAYILGPQDFAEFEKSPHLCHVCREIELNEVSICARSGGDPWAKVSYFKEIS